MFKKLLSRSWPFHLALLLAVALMVNLSHRFVGVPALGPFLSPFTGFWQNSPVTLQNEMEFINWPELKEPVKVQWDEFGIPHVFAENSEDLFRVQGFVHARHRLFQMELTSRAGEGRLSEILGDKTLVADLFFVRLGMRQAVQNSLDNLLADSETREALLAYSGGVNKYIDGLDAVSRPVEYKLLDTEPRQWSPRASVAIFMAMTFRLSGRSYDIFLTSHVQKHGWEKIKTLFPQFLDDQYIVPYPKGENSQPTGNVQKGFDQQPFVAKVSLEMAKEFLQPFATNGSNNWAFSGSQSKDQHTWIANDTHLSYSLPAIFYEQQLTTPQFNVYGASIIGSPGLQIGFHKSLGWAVTNGNSDVLDWYEVEFEKEYSDKYLFDGQWRELTKSVDTVVSRSGQNIVVTHEWGDFGKLYKRDHGTLGLAFRWMGHQTKKEIKTFLDLTKAKNYKDCLSAIQNYHAPIQNLICAGPKDLSIIHMGRAPKRVSYSGALVKDGRKTDPEWQELINYKEMPQTHQPKKGYVFSANQRIAPKEYKYYLSWDFEEAYRASQIENGLLKMNETPTLETFRALQGEVFSAHAAELLPVLLRELIEKNLEESQISAVRHLSSWNYLAVAEAWEMSLFNAWWESFEEELFKTHLGAKKRNAYPKIRRTFRLVKDLLEAPQRVNHAHYWFLGEESDGFWLKKILVKKINDSFQKAWNQLAHNFGDNHVEWEWRHVRPTQVPHILKVPAFSSLGLPKGGGRYTVDVNTGSAGAVWRHVAKIGKNFEAWTNFPGGPSGNPFSKLYDPQIKTWSENEYRKVRFLLKPDSLETEQ